MFGTYTHYQDGEANGISETFLMTQETESNTLMLTVKFVTGQQQIDSTCRILNNRIVEMSYTVRDIGTEIASGVYRLADKNLFASRTFAQNTKLDDTIPHDGSLLLDCPFVSSKGFTIAALAGKDMIPTFAPLLLRSERAGDLSKKRVTTIGCETIMALSKPEMPSTHYEYGYDYWLNDDRIVLRAKSDPHQYEIVLTEFDST